MCYISFFCFWFPLRNGTAFTIILVVVNTIRSLLVGSIDNIAFLIMTLIKIIICIAAFYGVYKEKRAYIIPFLLFVLYWLILFVVVMMLRFIDFEVYAKALDLYIAAVDETLNDRRRRMLRTPILNLFWVIVLVLTGFQYYFFLVVYSYYQDLRRKSHPNVPSLHHA